MLITHNFSVRTNHILKAVVNPSQGSPEDPHPVWVAVKSNVHISNGAMYTVPSISGMAE